MKDEIMLEWLEVTLVCGMFLGAGLLCLGLGKPWPPF
jgi:hypothetical protein